MGYTILMPCPQCGNDVQHKIIDEVKDDAGDLIGYEAYCARCLTVFVHFFQSEYIDIWDGEG